MKYPHDVNRRTFIKTGASAIAALPFLRHTTAIPATAPQKTPLEWRNKQSNMSYRRLGRTGFMISEVVAGGDPIRPDNYKQLELAIDMGLNYLDMAPAYGRGECERAYGQLLSGSALREKVFLTSKASNYKGLRNRLYKDLFDGLPAEKQGKITKRAQELRHLRAVEKPGYHFDYYPGQHRSYESAYLSTAMMENYGHKVDGSKEFQQAIFESVEESLKRVGTDYFDILMCPHGADAPEQLDNPEMFAAMEKLQKQGKIRYLGVSTHNDPGGVLGRAVANGGYDIVMLAYNILNGGYVEAAIAKAASADVGLVAMKTAHAVATHHKRLQPIPAWRIEKINRLIPGEMKVPMKGYLWALQNPNISAVISNLWDETFVKDNLSLAGKKIDLQPG
jgi:aryl-alcohol dehydrogenase-like predicted oxidoreductase